MMYGYLPDDLQAEQAQIERQRALAQMLQQNGQAPQGQMVSGRYVGPSWTQYLSNAVANYRGQSNMAEADQRQKALAEALQGRKQSWINSVPQDQPGQPLNTSEAGPVEPTPAQPASPQSQFDWAMKGMQIDPEMAKTAIALRHGMQKDDSPVTVKEGETLLNRKTMQPIYQNPKVHEPTAILQEYNLAKQQGYAGTIQDYVLERQKAAATKVSTETKISNFEPFNNKLQGGMADKLVSNFDALQNMPATIQALDKAKAYAAGNSFVGSGAEVKLALAKFANSNLGMNIKADDVKNTEALRSALFYNVMDNLKKMDASPSQQQQQFLQDAMGRITTDPKALPEIIDFWKGQLQSKAAEHNRRVDETVSGGKVSFPYDIHIKMPPGQQPAPASSGWSIKPL